MADRAVNAAYCGTAALSGFAVFVTRYGLRPLDPTDVKWLLVGDWGQHFLGWDAFRRESWTWPVGKIQNLNWPEGTSVVYTDSLPILSIPLKLLHNVLPDPFQFQGPWLLACFILLPVFGYLLLRQLTRNPWISALAAAFLPLQPYILKRDGHLALMAFWLILWAWLLYFTPPKSTTHFWFAILLLLAAGIHAYLLLMVMIIWGSWWLHSQAEPLLRQHSFGALGVSVAFMAASLVLLVLFMWALGYLVITLSGAEQGGFGLYSMNLNALFNPGARDSIFLPSLPQTTDAQYEGFQFPGVGVLLLLALGIPLFKYGSRWGERGYATSAWKWLWLPCAFFSLFAISDYITFNEYTLVTFDYPRGLVHAAHIFRASGRLFWPVNLILFSLAVVGLTRFLPYRVVSGVLAACLVIQLIDIHQTFPRRIDDPPANVDDPAWGRLLERSAYLGFIPRDTLWQWMNNGTLWPLIFMANRKGLPVNAMRTARDDPALYQANHILLQQLASGNLPSEASFLIEEKIACHAPESLRHRSRVIDDRIVLPAEAAGDVGAPLDPLRCR
jgi:hypothetical protein